MPFSFTNYVSHLCQLQIATASVLVCKLFHQLLCFTKFLLEPVLCILSIWGQSSVREPQVIDGGSFLFIYLQKHKETCAGSLLNACSSQGWVRVKPEEWNLIQVLDLGLSDGKQGPKASARSLSGCRFQGSWNQKQNWNSDMGCLVYWVILSCCAAGLPGKRLDCKLKGDWISKYVLGGIQVWLFFSPLGTGLQHLPHKVSVLLSSLFHSLGMHCEFGISEGLV